MKDETRRNRVLDDRLWDDTGREWRRTRGEWADMDDVDRCLAEERRVVLHGFQRPIQWLTPTGAAYHWQQIRPHFGVPGQYGAPLDIQGLTYAASVWRCGDEQLLGFEVYC